MGTTEIWATYTSDIASDKVKEDACALEAAEARGETRWACLGCSTWIRPSLCKCPGCGVSRKKAEKAGRMRQGLIGQMPGKAAVTATTLCAARHAAQGHAFEGSARVLLFGPHPEFGGAEAGLCQ